MSKSKKKGKKAMTIAIYILLITWIALLALLIGIYMLRLQGYENFTEWKNRNQSVETMQPVVVTPQPAESAEPTATPVPTEAPAATEVPVQQPEATPVPTEIAKITEMPEATPTATPEPTPTPVPTEIPVEEPLFSSNALIEEALRQQAADFFAEEDELCYAEYEVGIYYSVVFQKGEVLLPLVYNLTTGEQVTGSDLIKETYFAIIKERLQTYVAELYPEEAEDEFISYDQTYQAEDYQKFYLTEEQLVFCFEENTLTANHSAFSYGVELSEAKAFFYTDLEGNPMGHAIRELDPEAKMIAITFDDGPYPKIENKLLELFEQYDGRATFFFLGQRINDWYPDSPGTIYAAGHEVGSHTYSHALNFARVSAEEMWSEINRTNLLIAASTGYAPDYVRFPGGTAGKRTHQIPMVVVNWNLDSVDYAEKKKEDGAEIIFNRMKNSAHLGDGSIVLLHSLYENSYEAIAMFLPYLKEQGYELVTLSELFYYKGTEPENGVVYMDGNGNTN